MLTLKNLDALKCLVTASFCNGLSKVKAVTDESSNIRIALENPEDVQNVQGLTDPLALSSYLAHSDPIFFKGQQPFHKAEILQWVFYGQSELIPLVQGYLHFCNQNSRDVAFQQKQRKAKLVKSLCYLDATLQSKTFLVGERLTLADTFLAIDILPLFNVSLNGVSLIKDVCPSHNLIHLNRWHQTIVNQKSSWPFTNHLNSKPRLKPRLLPLVMQLKKKFRKSSACTDTDKPQLLFMRNWALFVKWWAKSVALDY